MIEIERLLRRELYRKSCYDFAKEMWDTFEPQKLVDGIIFRFFCETFQYFSRHWVDYKEPDIDLSFVKENEDVIDVRQGKNNLCINMPPRHSKSAIFNIIGPCWLLANYPIKVASVSHTTALASEMNNKRVKLLSSDKFLQFFGDDAWVELNSRGKLVDNRGGEMYSIARDSFTGHGADMIINDDLTNAETARRDREEMNSAVNFYHNTMPSRINDRNRYCIMNIQQRLAPNDITGHILADPKLAAQYAFIVLPAIFKKRTHLVCPVSGIIHTFEPGDTLWPERFGDYSALRIEVGETVFETQYLQNPIASDKTVVKQSMIVEKDKTEVPDISDADIKYASHDFPVKDKDTSDFLGSVLGYRVNATLYIADCLEKKMAFVRSIEYVKQLDDLYPGIIQVIEDKANGSPILQQLQDEVAGMQAYQPGTASKTQRLESATLYMESKNVVFVRDCWNEQTHQWELSESLANLKKRLLDFPFVEHDDITDAFSMLVLFVFMDRRYMVYGRSFDEKNVIPTFGENAFKDYRSDVSTVFFNKEGDKWKVLEIAVQYGEETKLTGIKETQFKASIEEGLQKLKDFSNKSVFIDCSATDALQGMYHKSSFIERYEVEDFDKSVAQLNLAFAKGRVRLFDKCVLTKSDIENFKFSKSKDENVRYATTKDGFVACLRVAMMYYGGIV